MNHRPRKSIEERLNIPDTTASSGGAEPRHTLEIMKGIKKIPEIKNTVDVWFVADGCVGLFVGADGHKYEISVVPAELGKHKGLFKQK